MTLLVPNAREVVILTEFLTPAHTLRLYSNDKTPAPADTVAAYTEVSGGGYVSMPLIFADYTITAGTPTVALYAASQQWIFTGPATPNSVYGYYVTRNSDGVLMWAERFPAGVVPFAPIVGSVIRVRPRITCEGGS